jgi:hypothetical protein
MRLIPWALAHRRSIGAFLAVWFTYGLMTNASDLHWYGLYQVGAESIVDFHTFTVGHSHNPEMRDAGDGDVFEYRGFRYIAKQPGAMIATALPYAVLKTLGYDYVRDYRFVAAVTAWTTAGLLAALSVVLFFHWLVSMGYTRVTAATVSFGYAFGTTLFPYTGVPHHDVLAMCLLFFAVVWLFRLSPASSRTRINLAGALLGSVLFFSMLPALMVAVVGACALFRLGFRRTLDYGLGFFLGNVPLMVYNYYNFDHPFRQANHAGNYDNTFFEPSLTRLHLRIEQYFGILSHMSVTKNMPVFVLGLAGIFFLKPKLRGLQAMVVAMVTLHLGYLFSIGTEGHCQFGPRYLIPLIPFVMVGFAEWFGAPLRAGLALIALAASVAINSLGALGDSMQCSNLIYFPATYLWEHLRETARDPRPLLPLMAVIAVLVSVTLLSLSGRLKRLSRPPRA